jgi:hypothetical protein
MGLRLSNDGTEVVQVAASSLSCAYNDSSGFVVDLNPPVNIVNGRFATSIRTQDAETPAIQIDGVFVDLEHTQLLGGMSVLFGRANARCNFQWAATKDDDEDWDGWSDAVEISFSSRVTSSRSTPEDHDLPSTALYGPGVCRDRLDNDADGNADAAEAPASARSRRRRRCCRVRRPPPGTGAISLEIGRWHSGDAFGASGVDCGAIENRNASVDRISRFATTAFSRDITVGAGSALPVPRSALTAFSSTATVTPREQALGGIVLRFGSECVYKWWGVGARRQRRRRLGRVPSGADSDARHCRAVSVGEYA